jgi:hypothetical protein
LEGIGDNRLVNRRWWRNRRGFGFSRLLGRKLAVWASGALCGRFVNRFRLGLGNGFINRFIVGSRMLGNGGADVVLD